MLKEKAFLLLILLSFIWGYNWVVMKQGIYYIPPLYFAFFRVFFGAIIIFGFMAFKKINLKPPNLFYTFLLGLLQSAGFTGLTVLALEFAKAGKTAILVYSMPFWLTLFSFIFLSQKPDKKEIISNFIAFAGLILILEPWNLDFIHLKSLIGNMLAILSGIFWALSVIWQKRHKHLNADIISTNAWQMLMGSVFILLMAFIFEPFKIILSKELFWSLSYNALFANALAWIIFTYAVKKLSPGVMGFTMLLAPIIGMISSMIILKERMDSYESVGSIFIISGLLIMILDHLKQG